jgi:hypothetical protein
MAFTSCIFAATESELDEAFPGWRRPLPQPVPHTFLNPFTKELVRGFTTDPANVDPSVPHVVPGDEIDEKINAQFRLRMSELDLDNDDYEGDQKFYFQALQDLGVSLESLQLRRAGFHKLQRVDLEDWFSWDTDEMLDIIAGEPPPKLHFVRFGTRHSVEAFPPATVALLAALAKQDLSALGTALSDGHFFSSRGWSAKTCAKVLGEIAAMAARAERPGHHLCFLMESP